jgi:hypothetical protein
MTESKYGKYIITELKPSIAAGGQGHLKLIYLDDEVIKGAFYVECAWIWPGCELYPTAEPEAHTHDFDEVITFFGTNPEDPYDLCGEIELWLEDEKHILTKSCLVFVPKGMKHCPLIMRRVDRPIFHFAAGTGGIYIKGKK